MAIKTIVILLVSFALPASCPAEAQQQAKVPKIGLLGARPAASSTGLELFRQEIRKLGYIEDKNIAFEYRSADNKFDRLPALADELVRLKVDVIVTPGTAEAPAAKNVPERSPSFFSVGVILLRLGWLTAWRGPGETSRGSPALERCWLANDWSYSRKPFPISPALRCFGIPRIQALRNNGKKASCWHENWVYNFIPWR